VKPESRVRRTEEGSAHQIYMDTLENALNVLRCIAMEENTVFDYGRSPLIVRVLSSILSSKMNQPVSFKILHYLQFAVSHREAAAVCSKSIDLPTLLGFAYVKGEDMTEEKV
jgi:hypothetical protein